MQRALVELWKVHLSLVEEGSHTGCDADGDGLFRQDDAGLDVVGIAGVVFSAVIDY